MDDGSSAADAGARVADPRPAILVGDDVGGSLRLASFALRASGYRVTRAQRGQRLISQYRNLQPRADLVLLDVSLPSLSSIHTYEVLHMLDRDLPALFLGEDDARHLPLLPEAARWRLLRPPYTYMQLLHSVDLLLGAARGVRVAPARSLAEAVRMERAAAVAS